MTAGGTSSRDAEATPAAPGLSADDLIPNRALGEEGTDAFGYKAVAGRVAETLTLLPPPLTVGLFGPYGSGKSSMFELIGRELRDQKSKAKLVKYDASTYGGEALKRNFISHIASELGYTSESHPEFHAGLYESRRTTSLDSDELKKSAWPALRIFLLAYIGFLFVFCLLAGLTSVATGENFVGEIGKNLPKLVAPTAIAGLVLVLVRVLLGGATVDSDQSQPATDEEFVRRFRELVEKGRKEKKFDRLIVFVDELDRCTPKDVVTTLTAIRTFLDEEHCVFVVAADRAALERALDEELPQPTPVDEENPYYSSASSYFDKVFHDRVPLPPLRGQRLYEYAYGRVEKRDGYWKELREGEGGLLLRRVLYFLIASHVRSPRRVNSLLTSFVRAAAIADERGFDWKGRAREIAKLTVLETEFPRLADDLRTEPRLLQYLLDRPEEPTPRLERLLAKHGGSFAKSDGEAEDDDNEGDTPVAEDASSDTVIADATPEQKREMSRTEREYLRRYLIRTRDVSIGRDLLFLEPAGAAIGMDDSELSDLLDRAVDEPAAVVDALRERDVETQQLAARVLANMADQEFGEEASNVMTSMLEIVEILGDDADPIADELVGSLRAVDEDGGLRPEHIEGGLALAIAAKDDTLQGRFLEDEHAFASAERTARVGSMLHRISAPRREPVYGAIARFVGENETAALTGCLTRLAGDAARDLFRAKAVEQALAAFLDREEEEGDRERVMRAAYDAGDRADGAPLRQAVQWFLVSRGRLLDLVRDEAESVLEAIPAGQQQDSHALEGIRHFPPEQWPFWAGYLSEGGYGWADQGDRAVDVLVTHLDGLHAADRTMLTAFGEMAARVLPLVNMAQASSKQRLLEAFAEELNAANWWLSDDQVALRSQLHEIGLGFAIVDGVAEDLKALLVADLTRAPLTPLETAEPTLQGLEVMGGQLGEEAASILTAMQALGATGTEPQSAAVALTRARLAKTAVDAGAQGVDATVLTMEEVLAASEQDGPDGRKAVAAWLSLNPSVEAVSRVILGRQTRAPSALVAAVAAWAGGRSTEERTSLVIDLVDAGFDAAKWVGAVGSHRVDETRAVPYIAQATLAATAGSRREELVGMLVALKPVGADAQKRVADLITELLDTGKQVDHKVAVHAIPALGTNHRSAGRLSDAFKRAADRGAPKLSKGTVKQLADSKVKVAKKSATENAVDALKNITGIFR